MFPLKLNKKLESHCTVYNCIEWQLVTWICLDFFGLYHYFWMSLECFAECISLAFCKQSKKCILQTACHGSQQYFLIIMKKFWWTVYFRIITCESEYQPWSEYPDNVLLLVPFVFFTKDPPPNAREFDSACLAHACRERHVWVSFIPSWV